MRAQLVFVALAALLALANGQEEAAAQHFYKQCSIANCQKCFSKWGGQQCLLCNSGSQMSQDKTTCTLCAAGTYNEFGAWGKACKACPTGYWSAAGSASCGQCAPGYGVVTTQGGGHKVKGTKSKAPSTWGSHPGSYWKGGWWHKLTCQACAAGTYSPGGTGACQACPAGTWSGPAASTCYDINACTGYDGKPGFPCNNGNAGGVATCTDLPAPAPFSPAGRQCTCNAGFVYQSDAVGCVATNINACTGYPCNSGTAGGVATCSDLPPPAGNNAAGRECTCNAGFTYVDDATGCAPDAPPPPVVQCNNQIRAQGSEGEAIYQVPVGEGQYIGVLYDTVGVPDLIEIYAGVGIDGEPIYRRLAGDSYNCFPDDGTLVPSDIADNGNGGLADVVDIGQYATDGYVTLRVRSPCEGTNWYAAISCSTDSAEEAANFTWPDPAQIKKTRRALKLSVGP